MNLYKCGSPIVVSPQVQADGQYSSDYCIKSPCGDYSKVCVSYSVVTGVVTTSEIFIDGVLATEIPEGWQIVSCPETVFVAGSSGAVNSCENPMRTEVCNLPLQPCETQATGQFSWFISENGFETGPALPSVWPTPGTPGQLHGVVGAASPIWDSQSAVEVTFTVNDVSVEIYPGSFGFVVVDIPSIGFYQTVQLLAGTNVITITVPAGVPYDANNLFAVSTGSGTWFDLGVAGETTTTVTTQSIATGLDNCTLQALNQIAAANSGATQFNRNVIDSLPAGQTLVVGALSYHSVTIQAVSAPMDVTMYNSAGVPVTVSYPIGSTLDYSADQLLTNAITVTNTGATGIVAVSGIMLPAPVISM